MKDTNIISHKTICILTEARSGSSYLSTLLSSDARYYFLNEFFTPYGTENIERHFKILSQVFSKHYNKTHYINYFKVLTKCIENNDFNKMHNSISTEMFDIIQHYAYNFLDKGVLVKIFDNHLTGQNISYDQLMPKIDAIILNYRRNILLTYISLEKAFVTEQWFVADKQNIKDAKILWDKQKFINFVKHCINRYNTIYQIYKNINRPKVVINYEDMHSSSDLKKYIQNKLDDAKIDIRITFDNILLPIKQSQQYDTYENYFHNKDDFARDFKSIEDYIYYNPT